MKRLLLIFALCLFLPRSVSAQSSSVDNFFRRYDASEGFTSVLLEQKMMQMMSRQAAQRGDKGLAVLLKDIEYIRIIALKGGDSGMLVRDAEAAVAADRKFQPVTSGTEDGQTTKFYIRETALSVKSELVMITYGAKETVVVNIYGEFDLKQVARLSSSARNKGWGFAGSVLLPARIVPVSFFVIDRPVALFGLPDGTRDPVRQRELGFHEVFVDQGFVAFVACEPVVFGGDDGAVGRKFYNSFHGIAVLYFIRRRKNGTVCIPVSGIGAR